MNAREQQRQDEDELLFHRFNMEHDLVFDNETPSTDLLQNSDNNLLLPLDKILDAFGGVLDNADASINDLIANDGMLGSAIVRACQDLANAIGHIATELEQQSNDDRRALAQACLEDAQETTRVIEATTTGDQQEQQLQHMEEFALMSTEDIMSALAGVSPLLRDVEIGLRGIEKDEADEIADVALTLAKLFVTSLQSFHSSLVVQQEEKKQQIEDEANNRFELLEDDDDDDDSDQDKEDKDEAREKSSTRSNQHNNNNNNNRNKKQSQRQQQRMDRLRVLWPPLGPAVAKACAWGKEEAIKQPILAVALGMTLWPAAVATAFVGAPLVAADALVQHTYTNFQHGAIVSNVERGAAQLYQAGKLSLLCGKLITRQSLRVINRQIERNGGIGPVIQNLAGMAVDKAMHPVETVTAVWDGLHWAWHMVQDNLQQLNQMNMNNAGDNKERRDASPAADGWQ